MTTYRVGDRVEVTHCGQTWIGTVIDVRQLFRVELTPTYSYCVVRELGGGEFGVWVRSPNIRPAPKPGPKPKTPTHRYEIGDEVYWNNLKGTVVGYNVYSANVNPSVPPEVVYCVLGATRSMWTLEEARLTPASRRTE